MFKYIAKRRQPDYYAVETFNLRTRERAYIGHFASYADARKVADSIISKGGRASLYRDPEYSRAMAG